MSWAACPVSNFLSRLIRWKTILLLWELILLFIIQYLSESLFSIPFSSVHNGWRIVSSLSSLISQLCVSFPPFATLELFLRKSCRKKFSILFFSAPLRPLSALTQKLLFSVINVSFWLYISPLFQPLFFVYFWMSWIFLLCSVAHGE